MQSAVVLINVAATIVQDSKITFHLLCFCFDSIGFFEGQWLFHMFSQGNNYFYEGGFFLLDDFRITSDVGKS